MSLRRTLWMTDTAAVSRLRHRCSVQEALVLALVPFPSMANTCAGSIKAKALVARWFASTGSRNDLAGSSQA